MAARYAPTVAVESINRANAISHGKSFRLRYRTEIGALCRENPFRPTFVLFPWRRRNCYVIGIFCNPTPIDESKTTLLIIGVEADPNAVTIALIWNLKRWWRAELKL